MSAPRPARAVLRGRRGFTLIELVVAIVIIGVLAAIAIPIYQNVTASSRAAAAEASMRTFLADAQTLAKARNDQTFKDKDVLVAVSELASATPGVSAAAGDWRLTAPPGDPATMDRRNHSLEWQRIGYVVSVAQRPSSLAAAVKMTDDRCVYGFVSYDGGIAVKHTEKTAEEIFEDAEDEGVSPETKGVSTLDGKISCYVSTGTASEFEQLTGVAVITPSAPLPPGEIPVAPTDPEAVLLPEGCADPAAPACQSRPAAPFLDGLAGNAFVDLNWTSPPGALSYNLYRRTGTDAPVRIRSGFTGTATRDTAVVNGTAYTYYVTAVNADGEGAASNRRTFTPLGAPAPDAPISLVASGGDRVVQLSWMPAPTGPAPTSYSLFRRVSATIAGGPAEEPTFSATPLRSGLTTTSFLDENLTNGVEYTYRVVAVNAVGVSPPSNDAPATPNARPLPPRNPRTIVGDSSVVFRWDPPAVEPPAGTRSYEVRVFDRNNNEVRAPFSVAYAPVAPLTSPQTIISNLVNGDAYRFEVRTVSAGQFSDWVSTTATPVARPLRTLGVPGGTTGDIKAGFRDGAAVRPVLACPAILLDGFLGRGQATPQLLSFDACTNESVPTGEVNSDGTQRFETRYLVNSVDDNGGARAAGTLPSALAGSVNSVASVSAIAGTGNGAAHGAVLGDGRYVVSYPSGAVTNIFDAKTNELAPFAGGNNPGNADGDLSLATFLAPYGVAHDPTTDTTYIADAGAHSIRQVRGNQVTTLVGEKAPSAPAAGYVDAASGAAARLNTPLGVALDPSRQFLYISDSGNHRIRRMSLTAPYAVTTVAGTGQIGSADGLGTGVGAVAQFITPDSLTFDPANPQMLYVADLDGATVRSVNVATSNVATLAGSGQVGYVDGPGAAAQLAQPRDIVVRGATLFLADSYNNRLRKIAIPATQTFSPSVTTFIGSGRPAVAGGVPGAAFAAPVATVTVQRPGGDGTTMYILDQLGNTVRKLYRGVVTEYAGDGKYGLVDQTGLQARFARPGAMVEGPNQNLYVADTANCRIRRIAPNGASLETELGVVTTLAGGVCTTGTGPAAAMDGVGTAARFGEIGAITYATAENALYVTDVVNKNVRRIPLTAAGTTTAPTSTVAGPGASGANGQAVFGAALGITATTATPVDSTLYVMDTTQHALFEVTQGVLGSTTVVAGTPNEDGAGDFPAPLFAFPKGVDISSDDQYLYFTDSKYAFVKQYHIASRQVFTVAHFNQDTSKPSYGSQDGDFFTSKFISPFGAEVLPPRPDGSVDIRVTDAVAGLIRNVNLIPDFTGPPLGVASTIIGDPHPTPRAGRGASAAMNFPYGIDRAADGTMYVADTDNNAIRKIATNGAVTTLSAPGQLYRPRSVAVLGSQLFVTDSTSLSASTAAGSTSGRLSVYDLATGARAVRTSGLSPSVWGVDVAPDGTAYVSTDTQLLRVSGGTATSMLTGSQLRQVTFHEGTLYVAEAGADRILSVNPVSGAATPVVVPPISASTVPAPATPPGTAAPATLTAPEGVILHPDGRMYISDTRNHRIVELSSNRQAAKVYTTGGVAGIRDGQGSSGLNFPVVDADAALLARLALPSGLSIDPASGVVLLADTANSRIAAVMPGSGHAVTNIAGDAAGFADAGLPTAQLNSPTGVSAGPGNVAFVADTGNHAVRLVSAGIDVSTLAGSGPGSGELGDGQGNNGRFRSPTRVVDGPDGTLYVADSVNNQIRRVSPTNAVTLLAGAPDGSSGTADGTGAAARFNDPRGITLDPSGNLYVADSGNHRIRVITPAGVVSTLAGSTEGSQDGAGAAAQLRAPEDLAYNPVTATLLVTERGEERQDPNFQPDPLVDPFAEAPIIESGSKVREIRLFDDPVAGDRGTVTTYSTGDSRTADPATATTFAGVRGIDVAASGTAYVTDGNAILVLRPDGDTAVVAGSVDVAGYNESDDTTQPGGGLLMNAPMDVSIRDDGALFVADTGNHRIRVLGAGPV